MCIPILRLSNVKICFCSPTLAMIVAVGFLNCPNIQLLLVMIMIVTISILRLSKC